MFEPTQMNSKTIFRLTNLSNRVQSHLINVYCTLCFTVCTMAFTTFLTLNNSFFAMLHPFAFVGILLLLLVFHLTDKSQQKVRMAYLMGIGAAKGLLIAPLIQMALQVNPSIVLSALLGTLCIFICFATSALLAKKRLFLYLGGILSSVMMVLAVGGLLNIFIGSEVMFTIDLYLGLVMFVLYIPYDTQMIIARAELGDEDYTGHALSLFTDLVAIFVRIVIILLRRNERNRKKEKE